MPRYPYQYISGGIPGIMVCTEYCILSTVCPVVLRTGIHGISGGIHGSTSSSISSISSMSSGM